ncbi:PAS domain S-box-containing protein [Streptomyces sp. T12]|uniref:SpoIIE family protein phosphatase n=1 Tax=Streptomyces sp. T12 TaxID=477697 RepID=UPI0011AC03C8|nr:SpoIIE family protein phosphatase [Streptomyces sp. T12]TWD17612.1 PAS domain S-box-containing protein [Streptomyces sp. T12]
MTTIRATSQHSSARGQPASAQIVIDQHGVITDWSGEAQELLGYPASEMVGKAANAVLVRHQAEYPDEDGPSGHGSQAPVILRCHDGHSEACQIRIRPVENNPGSWDVSLIPLSEASEALALDSAVLDALFTRSPTSLCVYDTALQLRRFNPAAEGMQGVFGQKSIGLTPHELWPNSNSDVFEAGMRQVLDTGSPLIDFEKRGYPPDDPEHEHIFANSAFRLEDNAGQILGLATTAVEITKQRVAEERIAFLAEASSTIGSSLDVLETSQQLATLAVPHLAEATTVDLFSPVISGEDPAPTSNDLLRAGIWCAGNTFEGENNNQPGFPYPPAASSLTHNAEPRQEIVELAGRGEPLYRETRGTQLAHSLVMPIAARGAILGFASFYRLGLNNPFSDFDLLTARDLVSRAALSIDNARRYTRERNAARGLQRDLSPLDTSGQSAVETTHYFAPDSSNGNWLDVIPISGARVALVLGTTNESGLRGAAAIGRLGAAVHALTDLDLDPEEVLDRLDTLVSRIAGTRSSSSDARDRSTSIELRCVYSVYDPGTGKLRVASAGHALPVVAHPDGNVHLLTAPVGPPLGTADGRQSAVEVDLEAGSTLVFSSASDGSTSMPESLIRVLPSAGAAPLQELRARILHEASGLAQPGGTVLLLARTRRLNENNLSAWDLPSDPAVVATARNLVHQQLSVWGLEAAAFVTELVVSELVTNAIRYADGPINLRVIHDHQALICEVSDRSTTAPHLRYARSSDEGGRGLFLIAELTQRWGTRFSNNGKTIWTEQELDELAA